MVAHSTVDEHNTKPASSSSVPPASPPRDTSTPVSAPPSATSLQPPQSSTSSPSSRLSTRTPGQQPSNHCLAPPQQNHKTHFPTFRCEKDFLHITRTASMLERSGFYWGSIGVEEAHRRLKDAAIGVFLIRDSRQKDVFFTLSYRSVTGPNSVRIIYKGQRFSLASSERSFPCLFALLEFYITSPKKSLSVPYRKTCPTLQELCRKQVNKLCGGEVERIERVPVNPVLKDFLLDFPYMI
ncbi:suppressor of cytokine signaling 1a [Esox lucius]|uniref:Suppressor of cytokine signaling 1 n=1 Tax=Esox lucius TaxID=8010 RepID=A0AAY5K282_ESOLU|nr:suppressor of cytokine signaling 1a [Esox lucius]XP_010864245.3 suppressor of cytokine signaling 1a [Esox lucius]